MCLRIYTGKEIVDLNISHIFYCDVNKTLCIYDRELSIYLIRLDSISHFAVLDSSEAGIGYKCYNDLDLAFSDLGFKEDET